MGATMFYLVEIVLSLVGILLILKQQYAEEGSSFFAGGAETFKWENIPDRFLFVATVIVIIAFLIIVTLHARMVA